MVTQVTQASIEIINSLIMASLFAVIGKLVSTFFINRFKSSSNNLALIIKDEQGTATRFALQESISSISLDDPQKGKWGGRDKDNGRYISATVEPIPDSKDLFLVKIDVGPLSDARPITGNIKF